MTNITLTYDLTLRDGKRIKGATLRTITGAEERQPDFPGSKIKCDLETVDTVTTTHSSLGITPKFFWAEEIFGREGNPLLLLEDREGIPQDIALIHIREGQTWIVRSEPTLDNYLGITVSNERNKVLFAGTGDLVEVEFTPLKPNLPPKQGHQLIMTIQEIYRWKYSSPMSSGHTCGSTRRDCPASHPDYGSPDGGQ